MIMTSLAVIQSDLETGLINAGVESILPESMKMSTFVRCAAVAMASSKDLAEADKDSVIMALSQCAKDGLVPDNKEAALVTFNTNVAGQGKPKQWVKKAQYLPMIDGVMKRARMSGQISLLSSKAVFNDDVFKYWMDENGEHINYEPNYQGGVMRLCFAFARLVTGELIVEVMTKADVDKVRASSKTGTYGPWADWYERMALKAVMHRLLRRLPNASEIVEMCEQGMNMSFDARTEKEIQPVMEDPMDKLIELVQGRDMAKFLPWVSKNVGNEILAIGDLTSAQATALVTKLENAKQ